MRRLLAGLVTLAAVIGMAAPVSAQTVGVVLMHGNTDSPDGTIALLAAAMEGAGYLVERPEMCWSYRRTRAFRPNSPMRLSPKGNLKPICENAKKPRAVRLSRPQLPHAWYAVIRGERGGLWADPRHDEMVLGSLFE